MIRIDIAKSKINYLEFKSSREAFDENQKGWAYSYVYSFEEIRDIYLLLLKYNYTNIKDFTVKYVVSEVSNAISPWNPRRVEEVLNSLKNFGWINKDYEICKTAPIFSINQFGMSINKEEEEIFKKVFFSYFRFNDFMSLYNIPVGKTFLNNNEIKNKSSILFSFSTCKNLTNCFFKKLTPSPELFVIPERDKYNLKNTGCMRFWDVFTTWGQKLKVLYKFNSKSFNYELNDGGSFACSYFLSDNSFALPPLYEFMKATHPNEKMINLNTLIFDLCSEYRKSITEIKDYIISQYLSNKSKMSFVRTSEVFINTSDKKKDEDIAYPKYKDSFVSHLIIR